MWLDSAVIYWKFRAQYNEKVFTRFVYYTNGISDYP